VAPEHGSEASPSAKAAPKRDPSSSGWSLKIGTALGIPIRVHFTFLLLLVWFAGTASARDESVPIAIVFILLLFVCVVMHELGHAAMARRFGVSTREIVLYPIGGVARLENMPSGKAELLIALAGPAVNAVLAVALLCVLALYGPIVPDEVGALRAARDLVPNLLAANLSLLFFNLIPAFPMDGGRVLRASLSLAMPEERATAIAAAIGQGIALLFGAAALLFGQYFLLFIALFVFLGAGQEASFHRQRAIVLGRRAREAMITRFDVLAPQDSLARAAELLLATDQQDFPVVDAWSRVVGILPRKALLRGLAEHGTGGAVLEVMRRDPVSVPPDADLDQVLRLLQASPGSPVLVMDDGGLHGIITLENLTEFMDVTRSSRLARA
jgi:Zn-dependent protease/CBS domain-containing protein